jgi:hypothetical protein
MEVVILARIGIEKVQVSPNLGVKEADPSWHQILGECSTIHAKCVPWPREGAQHCGSMGRFWS